MELKKSSSLFALVIHFKWYLLNFLEVQFWYSLLQYFLWLTYVVFRFVVYVFYFHIKLIFHILQRQWHSNLMSNNNILKFTLSVGYWAFSSMSLADTCRRRGNADFYSQFSIVRKGIKLFRYHMCVSVLTCVDMCWHVCVHVD